MYLQRNLESRLIEWTNSTRRKPLILRGARQVGKTSTIKHFGKNFSSFVLFDFERRSDIHKVFESDLVPRRIVSELEALSGQSIEIGKTLVVFDEVQECPRALMSLRYFFEELPELHLMAAGSLLEFALSDISFPVGRVQFETVYPLSFSEYLRSCGAEILIAYIPRLAKLSDTSMPESIYEKIIQHLKEYFVVGGMPEAVATFVKNRSYIEVSQIHDELIQAFKNDVQKYASGQLQIKNLSQVFMTLFKYSGKQITYTTLGQGDEPKRTKLSIALLAQAMLCHCVRSVHPTGLPLGAEASQKHFKLLFLDIGLGQRLAGLSVTETLQSQDLLKTFEGKLAEQFVGQQLLSESTVASEGREIYCWIRSEKGSSAEVDYLLVREGKVIPVEVKSGKKGRLRSLQAFINKYQKEPHALCLQMTREVSTKEGVMFLPLFSVL